MTQPPCSSARKALLLGLLTLVAVAGAAGSGDAGDLRPSVPLATPIQITPGALTFNAPKGGPNPPPQTIKVKNIGGSPFQWTAKIGSYTGPAPVPTGWLTVSPAKGHRGPGQSKTVSVAVSMTTLAAGTYGATITFDYKGDNPPGTNAVAVPVTLHVLDKAFIDVQPAAGLVFDAPTGSGLQPTQTLTLSNLGGQTLNNWTATIAAPAPSWLVSVTPGSGSTLVSGASIPLTVTVDATGLAQGTYAGEIDVTCANPASTNNASLPIKIPITLNVSDTPILDVSTTEVDFVAPLGNPSPPVQTVAIRNAGKGSLDWSLNIPAGNPWLTITPTSGTGVLAGVTLDPAFQVSVNSTGLTAGNTYSATLTFGGNATNAGSVSILITLFVSDAPSMDVQPPTLTYSAPAGGPDPAIQTITVTNQGGVNPNPLTWTATVTGIVISDPTWLTLSITQDTTGLSAGGSDQVQAIVSVAGLGAGTYTAFANFDDGNGTVITVFVTLNVIAGPSIELSQTSLLFDVPVGGAPSSQTVTLTNDGSGAPDLIWSAAKGAGQFWLSVSPAGGTLTAGSSIDLTITVDPQAAPGLTAGSVVGQISVTGNAPNSPQIISVTANANNTAKILLTPTSVSVDVPVGGAASQETVTLQNVGAADLVYTTSNNGTPWLGVSAGGTLTASQSTVLTLTFTPGVNPIGTHTALVTIASTAGGPASNTPQNIFVTMHVTDVPRIDLSPSSLVFNLSVGGTAASQQVTLSDVGGGPPLLFSIPTPAATWLSVAPQPTPGLPGSVVSGGNTLLTVTANPAPGGIPLAAGAYTGTVRIDSSNAQNAPQFISVTMNLTGQPRIGLSPTSLTFTTGVGATPANQTVTVTNTGGSPLTWAASKSVSTPAGGSWLNLVPAAPGSPPDLAAGAQATFDVAITMTGLAAGSYSGTITVTGIGATNTPQTIPVTLTVLSGPSLSVAPSSINFTTNITVAPLTQTLTVSNVGGSALTNWAASAIVTTPPAGTWLKISGTTGGASLAAGASAAPFNVDADVTGLAGGTYNATVQITADPGTGNAPFDVPVTLKVLSDPQISLSAPLVFIVTLGAGNPNPQTVTVTNVGDQTLNWSASGSATTPAGGTWLSLSPVPPTSGALTGGLSANFDVTIDVTGLPIGSYSGTVTVTGTAPTVNPSVPLGVTLIINAAAGNIPKAGYCGSIGFDVAFPLILLWAFRKWRGGRRAAAGIVPVLLVLILSLSAGTPAQADEASDLPRSLAQEEKAPEHPTTMPAPAQEGKPGEELFDFGGGALNPHIGLLAFSSDFKAKAEFCGGLGLRIPSPFLSTLFGPEKDRLGFFLDVTGSGIKRDVVGASSDSGTLIFATAGLYWMFLRSDVIQVELEGAAQYGYFGGVTNLTNGVAGLVGLRGAIEVANGLWITLEPQITFGRSSQLYFVNAGVDIKF
jgi:hypothetical protein